MMVKGVEAFDLTAARGSLQRAGGGLGLGSLGPALGGFEPARLEVQRVPAQAHAPPRDQKQQEGGPDGRQPAQRRQDPEVTAAHG